MGSLLRLKPLPWFCFSGDFLFLGLTKVPFGDYFLFFLGFLSKSKLLMTFAVPQDPLFSKGFTTKSTGKTF